MISPPSASCIDMQSSELMPRDHEPAQRPAEREFRLAAQRLQNVISQDTREKLLQIEFPDFTTLVSVDQGVETLTRAMEQFIKIMQDHQEKLVARSGTLLEVVKRWFRSSYPFAQLFLAVMKDGSSTSVLSFTQLRLIEYRCLS